MRELRRTVFLVAIFAAVYILYQGIPLGVVEERVTVVGMGITTVQGEQGDKTSRVYDLRLENGEIIRVTTEHATVDDGYVHLERRFSPIRFRMFYSLADE